ncbi:MAG: UDP-2,3-diacylglucosamine diphosphatase LpxI [Elusimicrobiaceae bacterium]|nr:UDP-2,3-diacylglucosamine diphosphatase LpxI [Elusimicrobiaceae bacterium]
MTERNKIGLVAGGGKYPVLFAREAVKRGDAVFTAGLKNAPDELGGLSERMESFRLGQVSALLEFFRRNGVTKIVMTGLVRHGSIFANLWPDLRAARILASLKDTRAETIFAAVEAEFKSEGIELLSTATYLEHLLAKPGVLAGPAPDRKQAGNIRFGWTIAKALSAVDVGLACAVCDRSVLALEAMEGTDECIRRAGRIYRAEIAGGNTARSRSSGPVVVKVARPRQDMRFDLPVIGKGTVEAAVEAGVPVLAVEAGKTMVFDLEEVLDMARRNAITVIALSEGLRELD